MVLSKTFCEIVSVNIDAIDGGKQLRGISQSIYIRKKAGYAD
jgi:hypothetical protein